MTFINRYIKPDSKNYYHTEEFTEGSSAFTFAVGTTDKIGLVSRIGLNGDLIWEKTFKITGVSSSLIFQKIIQLIPVLPSDPGYRYVIHAIAGSTHYLFGIKNDGSLAWRKKINWSSTIVKLSIGAGVSEYAFYIAISDSTNVPFAAKLNGSGTYILRKRLNVPADGVKINALSVRKEGITLVGKFDDNGDSLGLLIDLNTSLVLIESLMIKSLPCELQDVKHDEANYVVTGLLTYSRQVFTMRFSGVSNPFAYEFPNTPNNQSRVQLRSTGLIYVFHYSPTHGILNLVGTGGIAQWQKELRLDDAENGISKIHYNLSTQRLTTDAYNSKVKSLVVQTDDDFDSCKTINLNRPELPAIEMDVQEFGLSISNASASLATPTVQTTDIVSEIVQLCPVPVGIPIGDPTSFQSPNFYLQSAGSTGLESTKGIHNRWFLRGALGDKHLPKRDYAQNTNNFNKPNDLVKVYRTQYRKFEFLIDLFQSPTVVDSTNKFWIYRFGQRDIYVYFKNETKYNQASASNDPFTNPAGFYQSYGNNLIEVENKDDLFFAVQLLTQPNPSSSSYVRAETITVPDPIQNAPRFVSNRKKFSYSQFSNMKFISENGKAIRFQPNNCRIAKLKIEYYSDFIKGVNSDVDWLVMGEYGLNLNNTEVFDSLEPSPNKVNGKWKRFNENSFVKTANYMNRWNGSVEPGGRNLKQMVEKYIDLSDAANNPTAIESVPIGETPPLSIDVSNLELLNFASMDFHIARMLGLGSLDLDPIVHNGSYVYVAEYTSFADLEDGLALEKCNTSLWGCLLRLLIIDYRSRSRFRKFSQEFLRATKESHQA